MTEKTQVSEIPTELNLEASEVVAEKVPQEEIRDVKLGRTLLEEAGYSRRAIPLIRF